MDSQAAAFEGTRETYGARMAHHSVTVRSRETAAQFTPKVAVVNLRTTSMTGRPQA